MAILPRIFQLDRSPPWTEDSIFSVIRRHLDPATGSLLDAKLSLPDEAQLDSTQRIRFAPGAMDGILTHHSAAARPAAQVETVAKLLDRAARRNDPGAWAKAYALLQEHSTSGSIDSLLQRLAQKRTPVLPLQAFALQLATRSGHRGPVKAGIALLGATRASEHADVVLSLGKHEEFTLFSAVALRNMLPDPVPQLWELARHVRGWGRIHIVERLGPTESPELRYWLRTEGYKNSVMYEYLALTAATHGRLCEALERPGLPAQELICASEIIQAMIAADGGAADGMHAYADAARACVAFLTRVSHAEPQLRYFLAAHEILRYVAEDIRDTASRLHCGWTQEPIESVRSSASELIGRPVWSALVREQLDSPVDEEVRKRIDKLLSNPGVKGPAS